MIVDEEKHHDENENENENENEDEEGIDELSIGLMMY
jgi:hypothetical protein